MKFRKAKYDRAHADRSNQFEPVVLEAKARGVAANTGEILGMSHVSSPAQRKLRQLQTRADHSSVVQTMLQWGAVVQRKTVIEKAEQSDGRALSVKGTVEGEVLGKGANSPSEPTYGWQELKQAGHTKGNRGKNASKYKAVRMHLFNGRLGGEGKAWNLVPGPASVNTLMSKNFEEYAQEAVRRGNKLRIESTVEYGAGVGDGKSWLEIVPTKISCKYVALNKKNSPSHQWSSDIEMPEFVPDDEIEDDAEVAKKFDKDSDLKAVKGLLKKGDSLLRHIFLFRKLVPELQVTLIIANPQFYLDALTDFEAATLFASHRTKLEQPLKNSFNVMSQRALYLYSPLLQFEGDLFDDLMSSEPAIKRVQVYEALFKNMNPETFEEKGSRRLINETIKAIDRTKFNAYLKLITGLPKNTLSKEDCKLIFKTGLGFAKRERQKKLQGDALRKTLEVVCTSFGEEEESSDEVVVDDKSPNKSKKRDRDSSKMIDKFKPKTRRKIETTLEDDDFSSDD